MGLSLLAGIMRWTLVPVSAVAVVGSSAAAAWLAVLLADQRCPADRMMGGACVAPWHTTVVEIAIYVAIVLAVAGLVTLPSLIAPHLKRIVALVLLLAALAVVTAAYIVTGWKDLLMPLAVTALTGGAAFWWIWSRTSPHDAR